jgi:WhiB family redox-sensing transcriptional regulator
MTARFDFPPACLGQDPEIWFPLQESDEGERPTSGEARALLICRGCPIAAECLADRLAWEVGTKTDPWGVCGGKTAAQRRALVRSRKPVAA